MTTNTNPDGVPRWAATAGRRSLAQRLAAHGARLFGSSKRQPTDRDSGPTTDSANVPWAVRQRVLREYHTATLAQARRGSEELVRAGFNTGAVPYGYRPRRVRISPSGRRPRWRTRLVIEPAEAIPVKLIFRWRAEAGLDTAAIRRRLIDTGCPAPRDPETGLEGVWTRAAVRAILRNPEVHRPPGLGPPPPRTAGSPRAVGVVAGVGASAADHRRRVRGGPSLPVARGHPADRQRCPGVR